jgi:plastocyanin
MRPLALALFALIACVLGAQAAGASPARVASTGAVQASGSEFRIGLSRTKVKAGRYRVEFVNYGEDDHDLAITRKGSAYTRQLPTVKPGDTDALTVRLKRGTYVLWCTIDDHKARGMRAVIRVKK